MNVNDDSKRESPSSLSFELSTRYLWQGLEYDIYEIDIVEGPNASENIFAPNTDTLS